jgi:hypothetical protein
MKTQVVGHRVAHVEAVFQVGQHAHVLVLDEQAIGRREQVVDRAQNEDDGRPAMDHAHDFDAAHEGDQPLRQGREGELLRQAGQAEDGEADQQRHVLDAGHEAEARVFMAAFGHNGSAHVVDRTRAGRQFNGGRGSRGRHGRFGSGRGRIRLRGTAVTGATGGTLAAGFTRNMQGSSGVAGVAGVSGVAGVAGAAPSRALRSGAFFSGSISLSSIQFSLALPTARLAIDVGAHQESQEEHRARNDQGIEDGHQEHQRVVLQRWAVVARP